MKKALISLLAFGLSLSHSFGYVHAQEETEPEDETSEQETIPEDDQSEGDLETPEVTDGNTITVSFDVNEHGRFPWNDQELVHTITVEQGQSLQEYPDPYSITPGLVFAGWSRSQNGGVDLVKFDVFDYIPQQDEYFYAVWVPGYSVTLDANGGYWFYDHNRTTAIVSVLDGQPTRENPEPMNDNNDVAFGGWSFTQGGSADLSGDELIDYVPNSDITLYAVWEEGYTVTLDTNGGRFDWDDNGNEPVKNIHVLSGHIIDRGYWCVPSEEGKVFTGWSYSEDGDVDIAARYLWQYSPSYNVTLYAVYEDGYTVTLDTNGGRFEWDDDQDEPQKIIQVGAGSILDDNPWCVSLEQGKVFLGWSHSQTGEVEIDKGHLWEYTPSSDDTLYAIYGDGYKVTLDPNGGRFDWDDDMVEPFRVIEVGAGSILDDNPRCISLEQGKVFLGWSHSQTGEVEIDKGHLWEYTPSSDDTLYAIYGDGYKVTLDPNGGRFDWDDDMVEPFRVIEVGAGSILDDNPWCLSLEQGKVFLGWSHSQTGGVEIDKGHLWEYTPSSDDTLYAIYGDGYRVTLDTNGGRFHWDDDMDEPLKVIEVGVGQSLDEDPWCVSLEQGKVFLGWSHSQTGEVEIDKHDLWSYVPTSDETMYAIYGDGYKVTLNTNGGRFDWDDDQDEPVRVIEVGIGQNLDDNPRCLSLEQGKIFVGWSYSQNGNVVIDKDELWSYVPTEDKTLYAIYGDGYTIFFDANGGYYPWDNNIAYGTANIGERIDGIPEPDSNEPGLVFIGWSSSQTGEVEINKHEIHDYIPTSDMYLYAIYETGYKVTLDTNGGRFEWDNEQNEPIKVIGVSIGENLEENPWCISMVQGKVFVGWSHSQTGEAEIDKDDLSEYVPTGDETLYAIYADGYTVTLDCNGGHFTWNRDETIKIIGVLPGENLKDNPWAETDEPGMVFVGWSHSQTGEVEISKHNLSQYVPQADETLYAVYAEGYTVTLDANGGYFDFDDIEYTHTVQVASGDNLEEDPWPTTDAPGMVFAGWSKSETGGVEIDKRDLWSYVPQGNETLYAVYVEGYTVTLDANGGYFDFGDIEYTFTALAAKGEALEDDPWPTIDAPGMVFVGWSHSQTGDVDIDKHDLWSYVPLGNETLYAVYAEGYIVSLDANGGYFHFGAVELVHTVQVAKGHNVDENPWPITDEQGKVFAGWSFTKTGDVDIDKRELHNYVPASDLTLYAVYKDGYIVSYDGNGGYFNWWETHYAYTYVIAGDSVQADIVPWTDAQGVVFAGWSRTENGAVEITRDEMREYVPSSDEQFYAVWQPGYKIIFDVNGGRFPFHEEEQIHRCGILAGNSIQEYPDPYSITPGKVFAGWSKTKNGPVDLIKYDVFDYIPQKDEYYYAVWDDGYSIKLEANGGFFWDKNRTFAIISVLLGQPANENPEPMTDEDLVFIGWSRTIDGPVELTTEQLIDYVPTSDETLYAQWSESTGIIITKQPEDVYAADGETTVVSVEAQGTGLKYTWYFRNKGKTAWSKSSETSSQYTMVMSEARDGRQTYCVVKDSNGNTVESDIATYHLQTPLAIITQPEDVYAADGETTVVSIEAQGTGLTYTWYFRNKGKTIWTKSSETSSQYTMVMSEARDERQTYCVVKDSSGNTVESNIATYHLETPLAIITQPQDVYAADGETTVVSVQAQGKGLTYTWYFRNKGKTAWSKSSETSSQYRMVMSEARDGRQTYCVVKDSDGNTLSSDIATYHFETPFAIITQPQDVYAADGETTVVSVEAQGKGLTYTWYFRNKGKTAWSKSSETSSQYTMVMSEARDGRQTYCVVKDSDGNTLSSDIATYHFETPLAIIAQPGDVYAVDGETTVVSVQAQGKGLTYTWYFRNAGKTIWTKSSETSNQYTMVMSEARDGRQTYCVVKDSDGNTLSSDIATYHLETPLAIITHPQDVYAADGETTVVSVGAQGKGLTYTWYFRNAGKTAWSKSSETSSQYTMVMSEARDGRQTYVVVKDSDGNTLSSDIVTYHLESHP